MTWIKTTKHSKTLTEERNKNPQTQSVAEWIRDYEGEKQVDMSKFNAPLESDNDLKADHQDNMGKTFKLTIKDVGSVTYPPGKYSDSEVTKSTLFFNEIPQRLVVRPAMNRHLCQKYGTDSTNWVGKSISAESESWKSDTGSGWMWTLRALDVEFDEVVATPDEDFSDDIPFS